MLYYEKGAKETRGIPKKATEAALSAVVLQWHSCAGGEGAPPSLQVSQTAHSRDPGTTKDTHIKGLNYIEAVTT